MANVVMRGLNKKYDEVHAVKDVNLVELLVQAADSDAGHSLTP